MKSKNIFMTTVISVIFALTSGFMVHAADDSDSAKPYGLQKKGKEPYGLSKKDKKPYGLTKPKKGEAGNLFFQNRTPYIIKIYATIRNENDMEYGTTTVYLGEIPAKGASTNFSIPKDAYIGRQGTKYEIEIINEQGTTLAKKDFKFKLKNKNDSYNEKIEVKDAANLMLKVEFDKQSGIDMTLTPA